MTTIANMNAETDRCARIIRYTLNLCSALIVSLLVVLIIVAFSSLVNERGRFFVICLFAAAMFVVAGIAWAVTSYMAQVILDLKLPPPQVITKPASLPLDKIERTVADAIAKHVPKGEERIIYRSAPPKVHFMPIATASDFTRVRPNQISDNLDEVVAMPENREMLDSLSPLQLSTLLSMSLQVSMPEEELPELAKAITLYLELDSNKLSTVAPFLIESECEHVRSILACVLSRADLDPEVAKECWIGLMRDVSPKVQAVTKAMRDTALTDPVPGYMRSMLQK